MNEMSHDELLSAYLDGELSADQQAQVERRLASDPRARQLVDDLRTLRATLQELPEQKLDEDLAPIVLRLAERRMLTEPAEPAEPDQSGRPTPAATVRRVFVAAGRRLLNPRGVAWAAVALLVALLLWLNETGRDGRERIVADRPPAEQPDREPPVLRAAPGAGEAAAEGGDAPAEETLAGDRLAEKSAGDGSARRELTEPGRPRAEHANGFVAGDFAPADLEGAAASAATPGAPGAGAGPAPAEGEEAVPGRGAMGRFAAENGLEQGDHAPEPPIVGKGGLVPGRPMAEPGPDQVAQGREGPSGHLRREGGTGMIAKGGPATAPAGAGIAGGAPGELAQAEAPAQTPAEFDGQGYRFEHDQALGVQVAGGLMLVYCDVNSAGLENRTLDNVLVRNGIVFEADTETARFAQGPAGDPQAQLGTGADQPLARAAGTTAEAAEPTPAAAPPEAEEPQAFGPEPALPSAPPAAPAPQQPPAATEAVPSGEDPYALARKAETGGRGLLSDEAAGRALGQLPVEAIYVEATPEQIQNALSQLAAQRSEVVSLSVQPAPGVAAQKELALHFNRRASVQRDAPLSAAQPAPDQSGAQAPPQFEAPAPEEAPAEAAAAQTFQALPEQPAAPPEGFRRGRAQRVPLLSAAAGPPEAMPGSDPRQVEEHRTQEGGEAGTRQLAGAADQPAPAAPWGAQRYAPQVAQAPPHYRVLFVIRLVDSGLAHEPPAAAAAAEIEAAPAENGGEAAEGMLLETPPVESAPAPAGPAAPALEQ